MKLATQVHISGDPVATFTFYGLPSVNTHYGKHHRPRGIETNEWRLEAREEAQWWMFDKDLVFPVVKRALVIVKVWVPTEGIMDVHNEYIKALLDGFTDARLYEDDEWAFVPMVINMWAGISTEKAESGRRVKRTDIEIHELGLVKINGEFIKLPKGRHKYEINWDTSTEV